MDMTVVVIIIVYWEINLLGCLWQYFQRGLTEEGRPTPVWVAPSHGPEYQTKQNKQTKKVNWVSAPGSLFPNYRGTVTSCLMILLPQLKPSWRHTFAIMMNFTLTMWAKIIPSSLSQLSGYFITTMRRELIHTTKTILPIRDKEETLSI